MPGSNARPAQDIVVDGKLLGAGDPAKHRDIGNGHGVTANKWVVAEPGFKLVETFLDPCAAIASTRFLQQPPRDQTHDGGSADFHVHT